MERSLPLPTTWTGGSGIVPAAVIAILLNILIPKDKAAEPFQVE